MTRPKLSVPALQDQIAQALRAYLRASKADRPDILRTAADLTVQLRECFPTAEGEPDWLGATFAYRRASGEVWDMVGLSGRDRSRVQEALRWHISNSLRARLAPATLHALGLREESAIERGTERRRHYRATIDAARSSELRKGNPLRIVGMGLKAITALQTEQIAGLSEEQKVEMLRFAEHLEHEVARLKRACKE